MKAWVVWGSIGEYEDRQEWPVAVYTTPEAARHHAELAQEQARHLQFKVQKEQDVFSDYDPGLPGTAMYLEVTYKVTELPMVQHVDEFLKCI